MKTSQFLKSGRFIKRYIKYLVCLFVVAFFVLFLLSNVYAEDNKTQNIELYNKIISRVWDKLNADANNYRWTITNTIVIMVKETYLDKDSQSKCLDELAEINSQKMEESKVKADLKNYLWLKITFIKAKETINFNSDTSKWGYIDQTGKVMIDLAPVSTPVPDTAKWGYIDRTGKIVIEPQYKNVRNFSEGFAFVSVYGATWDFIDVNGKSIAILSSFQQAYGFSGGVAWVKKSGGWTYVNPLGIPITGVISKLEFDDTIYFTFHEDLICVREDNRWGFIDKTGKIIIKPQFDYPTKFSDGLARIRSNDKFGYIDKTGKFVIKLQAWEHADDFYEGLACVSKNGKIGYIDKTGKYVIKPQPLEDAYGFSEGLAPIKKDRKWGFIDKAGKIVIEPQYSDYCYFEDGFARVKKDGKFGLINTKGEVLGAIQYDSVEDNFKDALVGVKKDGKWGCIDKTGKIIVEPQFDNYWGFSDGFAKVKKDNQFSFINAAGKILETPYEDVLSFHEGLAGIKKDGKWGYIDSNGKIVIEPQFEDIVNFSEGLAAVKIKTK